MGYIEHLKIIPQEKWQPSVLQIDNGNPYMNFDAFTHVEYWKQTSL